MKAALSAGGTILIEHVDAAYVPARRLPAFELFVLMWCIGELAQHRHVGERRRPVHVIEPLEQLEVGR